EIITETAGLTLHTLRRAAELVQRFKRSSMDQTSDELRYFEVREVLEDVLASLGNRLQTSKVQVIIDCPDKMSIVSVPGLLEQVLINLIQNSLLHGFDEENLGGEIYLACSVKKERFCLEYGDDGKGMSKETANRIFEPFFTTKRGSGGNGLGMYICYNLVHRHQGTLYCESELGEGVWFQLELPTASIAELEEQKQRIQCEFCEVDN
ncbi:MAG: sensor histidine kinase, partial [Candidatus Electrothrix sp. AR3]|nr:sensor histidine kinase [Candidatus Electrothrix sp. AR3]